MNKKELLERNKQSFLKKSKEKWGENSLDYSLMDYITTKNNYYSYCNNYFSKDLYFDSNSIKQIIKNYEKTKLNSICS